MATYSFMNVSASLVGPGGVIDLGYGAGTAEEGISVSMAEEKVSTATGADGAIMHSLHASQTGMITVRLLKTSPVNKKLSDLINFQRSTPSNYGQNTLVVTDSQRGDFISGTQMAFIKFTDIAYGKDANMNEWQFRGYIVQELGSGVPDINI